MNSLDQVLKVGVSAVTHPGPDQWFLSESGFHSATLQLKKKTHSARSESSVPPEVENTLSQFHQCPTQQSPQGDTHHTDPHLDEPLQAGAQRQTEGQLQEQSSQVPQPPLQALLSLPWVEVRLAASNHLNYQDEDDDCVKGPDREEDQKPVPVDLGVELEDQHDKKDQGEDPGQEHSLDQGHLHL